MKKISLLCLSALLGTVLFCSCGKPEIKTVKLEILGPEGMVAETSGLEFSGSRIRLAVPAGKYMFRFSAPGFRDDYRELTVKRGSSMQYKVKLEPAKAAVLIKSNPVGAQVTMNTQTLGVTPLVIPSLEAGKYSARLSLHGHSDITVNWSITDERPVAVTGTMSSSLGFLRITSTPTRARVFIDGVEVGETPYRIERNEGKYVLRLEKESCNPEERNVHIVKNSTKSVHVALGQKPGGISVTSSPGGAEVFIDSVKRGVTPCTVNGLEPGMYTITLKCDGYDSKSDRKKFVPAATDSKHYELLSSSGSVMFNVTPAGVQVSLDGKSLGRSVPLTPGALATKDFKVDKLSPGTHELRLFHAMGRPTRKTVRFTVRKGKCTTLKNQNIWVANCEITRMDGTRERGALFGDDKKQIFFESEPGIRVELDRSTIRHIRMLSND